MQRETRAMVNAELVATDEEAPAVRGVPLRQMHLRRMAALFLAPAASLLLVLVAYPLFNVLWQSLNYGNLVDPSTKGFAGLDNYRTVLEDEDFAAESRLARKVASFGMAARRYYTLRRI